jgi:DNA-binding XRE family transcriptional regulator
MYKNLIAEMEAKHLTKLSMAKQLNMRYATLIDKTNGKYPFTLNEAKRIKDTFFPDLSLEYLFSNEEGDEDDGIYKHKADGQAS